MEVTLIQGKFKKGDAVELITQLLHVKIKFHESKIHNSMNEEDVKMRESKIKRLQKELGIARQRIEETIGGDVNIESIITVNEEIALG